MIATYHERHFKIANPTPALLRDLKNACMDYDANNRMLMHHGYPDLVHSCMKILARHGCEF